MDDRVEADRHPAGMTGQLGQRPQLVQGLVRREHSPFDGGPAQPGDREQKIELVILAEQGPERRPVLEQGRKILGPQDEGMNAPRPQVDRQNTPRGAQDLCGFGPHRPGQPVRKMGGEVGPPGGADHPGNRFLTGFL